jgi:hypothetical protein
MQVVCDNDLLGDDVESEAHVFGIGHGCVEVKLAKSIPRKIAPSLLMVELMRSLAVVRSVVGVALLPG